MPKERQRKENFDIHRTLPSRSVGGHRLGATNTPLGSRERPEALEEKKRLGIKRILLRTVVSLFLLVLLFFIVVGTWDGIELSRASKKMFGSGNLFSLLFSNDLKTDNTGRVNILLAGNSADDPGHQGAALTDSIMLISLNKNTKTGYMLSIPRDLYVSYGTNGCPYGDSGKINAVYECGQWENYSNSVYGSGGMGLLSKVVSKDFGVSVNYYALIDYSAFRDMVNAVGGIDIYINSPDGRLYDPNKDWTTGGPLVNLSNGWHHLDGQQALDLARARGDPSQYGIPLGFENSDFQRTADQRQMLLAVKKKAISLKNIINPTKAGHLFDGVANNIQTDLDIGAALPLYRLFDAVSNNNIKSYSLQNLNGKNYITSYSSYYSGDSLIPSAGVGDFSQIQAAIAQLNQ